VWVIYPGGVGDQRADRAILTALREQVGPDAAARNAAEHASVCEAIEPAAMRVVVTRDIRLAKRARRRGATVIDPAAFFAECDAGRLP
jgi:rRNA-processing protein FCF1